DRDIQARRVQTEPTPQVSPGLSLRVAFDVDAVRHDADPGAREPVVAGERIGAEGTDSGDVVGESIEVQAIGKPTLPADHVGIVTTVLGEHDTRSPAQTSRGERSVETGRVLMGVHDLDAVLAPACGHPADQPTIESRLAVEGHDRNPRGAQVFT